MGDYEYRRGTVVLRKTGIGQAKIGTVVSDEPWVNMLNDELAKLFSTFNSDIRMLVNYYRSKRPALTMQKVSGPNIGVQVSADTEHCPLVIKSCACIYSKVGADKTAFKEAIEYAKKKYDEMVAAEAVED